VVTGKKKPAQYIQGDREQGKNHHPIGIRDNPFLVPEKIIIHATAKVQLFMLFGRKPIMTKETEGKSGYWILNIRT